MCARSKFFRENVRFFTLSLFKKLFFKYSSSLRNFQNTFSSSKQSPPYKTLFKRLYLQHSYYLNQNFCYSLTSAPHCVKNLTYVWYLINLYQTPSLFTALNKISLHSCPPDLLFILFCPLFFSNINNFPYKTLNSPYLYLISPL